jgi:hypothetical protein
MAALPALPEALALFHLLQAEPLISALASSAGEALPAPSSRRVIGAEALAPGAEAEAELGDSKGGSAALGEQALLDAAAGAHR